MRFIETDVIVRQQRARHLYVAHLDVDGRRDVATLNVVDDDDDVVLLIDVALSLLSTQRKPKQKMNASERCS